MANSVFHHEPLVVNQPVLQDSMKDSLPVKIPNLESSLDNVPAEGQTLSVLDTHTGITAMEVEKVLTSKSTTSSTTNQITEAPKELPLINGTIFSFKNNGLSPQEMKDTLGLEIDDRYGRLSDDILSQKGGSTDMKLNLSRDTAGKSPNGNDLCSFQDFCALACEGKVDLLPKGWFYLSTQGADGGRLIVAFDRGAVLVYDFVWNDNARPFIALALFARGSSEL